MGCFLLLSKKDFELLRASTKQAVNISGAGLGNDGVLVQVHEGQRQSAKEMAEHIRKLFPNASVIENPSLGHLQHLSPTPERSEQLAFETSCAKTQTELHAHFAKLIVGDDKPPTTRGAVEHKIAIINEAVNAHFLEFVQPNLSESRIKKLSETLARPLVESRHAAHETLVKQALKNVSGNESIPDSYKQQLPQCIHTLIGIVPDIMGLVAPARKGATAWRRTVGHSTRGAGFAYELLGTVALIQNPSSAIGGGDLMIKPGDRVDLGVKLQAHYGGTRLLLEQPKRQTCEADAFIQRDDGQGGSLCIGIDFKHSQNATTYSGGISKEALEGAQVALKTGEIHEFHFVTNGTFGKTVREAVKKANQELKGHINGHPIKLHEKVAFQP